VDFGLVKRTLQTGNTTAVGQVVGTYRYMSPEQARGGRVDGRSDLYSVGSVLYEMLSSRPPFLQTRTPDLLHAIVYETPPPVRALNSTADPVLAEIAERLLHKSPDSRFASAVEVARLIRASKRQ
jgi:serine/threonine protein kinase